MREFELLYAPRAEQDLATLETRFANQILDDLELLTSWPWPAGKVKRLRGCPYSEIKTGDYRTVLRQDGDNVVIVRVVNRKDLDRAVRKINTEAVSRWLDEERARREAESKPERGK